MSRFERKRDDVTIHEPTEEDKKAVEEYRRMKRERCEHCGAALVAPEEFRAHADGSCAKLDVPPPPDLNARIRYARAQETKRLELETMARRRGSSKGADQTNDDQRSNTIRLAELYDEYRRKHPEYIHDKEALPAFRLYFPKTNRPSLTEFLKLPNDDEALARRIRRGREYRREK